MYGQKIEKEKRYGVKKETGRRIGVIEISYFGGLLYHLTLNDVKIRISDKPRQ